MRPACRDGSHVIADGEATHPADEASPRTSRVATFLIAKTGSNFEAF